MSAQRTKVILVTADRVRQLLHYCPRTGVFHWRRTGVNSLPFGAIAGRANDRGYVVIKIDQKQYRAHRLAWLYEHGVWPAGEIDHINGNKSDNSIANLRDVERSVNRQNQRKPLRTNRLQVQGVKYCRRNTKKPFVAIVTVGDRAKYLGAFETPEAASEAYVKAKRALHMGCTL